MGNPNMIKGGPPVNPGGRPKVDNEFRATARRAVDRLVLSAWINEIETLGKDWMRASELMTAYAYGKPKDSLQLSQDPDEPVSACHGFTHKQLEAIALERMEKLAKESE